jgi:hypothetical protein
MTSLFDKLAAAEEEFFESRFLSPVLRGKPIRVRIEGIVMELKVRPQNFEGWGIFGMYGKKTARFVEEPNMKQKAEYLNLYPKFTLIVCQRNDDGVRGILANRADTRINVQGQIPVALPFEVQIFDSIDVRFDGANFWYEGKSTHRSPRVAQAMREALIAETEPNNVNIEGSTFEERLAFAIGFDNEIESKKDRKEERLKKALERGGATLRSYIERGNTYTVEYEVDGRRLKSVVDSETLSVTSAGICLTDHQTGRKYDTEFDLQSLVGVIREGQRRGQLVVW